MGGFGGYKVIGYKNLDSLNAELNTVMLRRKKEEVLDLPPKLYLSLIHIYYSLLTFNIAKPYFLYEGW